jgi:hypothetical protein
LAFRQLKLKWCLTVDPLALNGWFGLSDRTITIVGQLNGLGRSAGHGIKPSKLNVRGKGYVYRGKRKTGSLSDMKSEFCRLFLKNE